LQSGRLRQIDRSPWSECGQANSGLATQRNSGHGGPRDRSVLQSARPMSAGHVSIPDPGELAQKWHSIPTRWPKSNPHLMHLRLGQTRCHPQDFMELTVHTSSRLGIDPACIILPGCSGHDPVVRKGEDIVIAQSMQNRPATRLLIG